MTTAEESPCVLVVEDDGDVLEFVLEVLRDHGYRAVGVRFPEEALRVLGDVRPDLIVLDLLMPPTELDGFEFLDRVRKSPRGPGPPVLIVSALGPVVNMEALTYLGARGVISKPFEPHVLLARIEGILAESRGLSAVVP